MQWHLLSSADKVSLPPGDHRMDIFVGKTVSVYGDDP